MEIARLLFKQLDPTRLLSTERQAYALLPRESGKTNICTILFPLYLIYLKGYSIFISTDHLGWNAEKKEEHKDLIIGTAVEVKLNEDFIVINSQTLNRAEGFVTTLKTTIESRDDLAKIFGEKDPRIITEANEQRRKLSKIWRVNSFITKDETVVAAIGSSQHIRGLNILGKRPSLIIADDIYSEENTRSDEMRKKISKIFWSELINTASTEKGKILLVGTMVHPDTIFKDIVRLKNWFGIEKRIISIKELQKLIQECTTDGKFTMPSYEQCLEFDKRYETILWKEFKGTYFILTKYHEALVRKELFSFYQEYMNEAIPPEAMNITKDNFYTTDIKTYTKEDRQIIEFEYGGLQWQGTVNLYVGLDPASSMSMTSDDTAIVTAGLARCYPMIVGKDTYSTYQEHKEGRIFPVIMDCEGGKYSVTNFKHMRGMTEALLELDIRYRLNYINIESAGQQEQIIREIMKNFYEQQGESIRRTITGDSRPRTTSIWAETIGGILSKTERILSILLPLVQRYEIVICNNRIENYIDTIIEQLLTLGSNKHDDYVDAWHIAMRQVRLPVADGYAYRINRALSEETKENRYTKLTKVYGKRAWLYN